MIIWESPFLLSIFNSLIVVCIVILLFMFFKRAKKGTIQIDMIKSINHKILEAINQKDILNFRDGIDEKLSHSPNDFKFLATSHYLTYLIANFEQIAKGVEYERKNSKIMFFEQAIDYILLKGCEVDYKDEVGRTALFSACWWGSKHMIELFLKKGADPNRRMKVFYDFTIMSCLIYKKNFHLAASVFKNINIDFDMILEDIEVFGKKFADVFTQEDLQKAKKFVIMYKNRKRAVYLMNECDNHNDEKKHKLMHMLTDDDRKMFIKDYLIRPF